MITPEQIEKLKALGFESDYAREMEATIPGEFGFSITIEVIDWWYDNPVEPNITVGLPHQCDSWQIVAGEDSVTVAMMQLSDFIRQSREAFNLLDKVQEVLR